MAMDGTFLELLKRLAEELANIDQPRPRPPLLDAELVEPLPDQPGAAPPRRVRPDPAPQRSSHPGSTPHTPTPKAGHRRPEIGSGTGSGVHSRVGSTLTTSLRQEGSLAQDIEHADERMQAHLSDKFEHQLGELGAMTGQSEQSTYAAAKTESRAAASGDLSLLSLLRSPQGLRSLVIANELLRLPSDRW